MKVQEVITLKENEYAENITVDWNQLKAALTVIASDPDLKGVKPVDAIMFLGIIGDPKADPIDVKLKRPAKFGVFNNKAPELSADIQGQYVPMGHVLKDKTGKWISFSEYDILINPKYWQALKADEDTPELVAHEARHRGFDIIFRNRETLSKIPPQLQKYYEAGDWPQDWKPRDQWDSWEHMCLWSLERRGRSGFGPGYYFKNKQEMLQFRQWYYQLEAAAKAYVATLQVPPGGYEALRKAIDDRTPDNIEVSIKKAVDGLKAALTPVTNSASPDADKPKTTNSNNTVPTPAKSPSTDKPNNNPPQGGQAQNKEIYTVVKGDNLTKIARRFGWSNPSALIKANPQIKNPDLIYPGDQIIIP